MTNMLEELKEIRRFLETQWVDRSPEGNCDFVCRFLMRLYPEARIAGGFNWKDGKELTHGGGYLDNCNHWNLHYWLELDGHIMDLASDQFAGGFPVVWILREFAAGRYVNNADSVQLRKVRKLNETLSAQWFQNWEIWQGQKSPAGRLLLLRDDQPYRLLREGASIKDALPHLADRAVTWTFVPEV